MSLGLGFGLGVLGVRAGGAGIELFEGDVLRLLVVVEAARGVFGPGAGKNFEGGGK